MKMKFIGKTDENFTNNCTYEFVEICYEKNQYFKTYIINDNDKVRCISYLNINTFLQNWETTSD